MMNTKDPTQFLEPFVGAVDSVIGVTIPGEDASRPAEDIAMACQSLSIEAGTSDGVSDAVMKITDQVPDARILICGSLYLAGSLVNEFDGAAHDVT